MEDKELVQMYLDRDEDAIDVTIQKYGNYCLCIAHHILSSNEDVEECINDTYLKVWKSIPPHRPDTFSTFIGKITRNAAINILRHNNAEKRSNGEVPLILDELSEIVSGESNPEEENLRDELIEEINDFLASLPADKRIMFVRRYWYSESIAIIAEKFGITENNVSVTLNRARKQLKKWLKERGYDI